MVIVKWQKSYMRPE